MVGSDGQADSGECGLYRCAGAGKAGESQLQGQQGDESAGGRVDQGREYTRTDHKQTGL